VDADDDALPPLPGPLVKRGGLSCVRAYPCASLEKKILGTGARDDVESAFRPAIVDRSTLAGRVSERRGLSQHSRQEVQP
jgi:hypothetical protein